jgi:nucleotide-binding universal stress UspA family protein
MNAPLVVGVDGSEAATRAVQWCAEHAAAFGAEVVVVHAVDFPVYAVLGPYPIRGLTEQQRDDLRDVCTRDWCKPLADAGVKHRVELLEGPPAQSILQVAHDVDAQLIVTGRRGLGGFKEFVLGSTSHQLTHQADRPLVIVP